MSNPLPVSASVPGPSTASTVDRRTFLRWSAGTLTLASTGFTHAAASPHELPLLGTPSLVRAFTGDVHTQTIHLVRNGNRWTAPGLEFLFQEGPGGSKLLVSSADPLQRLHLRWPMRFAADVKVLGDAWERSYGELEWLPIQPERVLPWYCLVSSGTTTRGFGVKAGARSLAFWQVDRDGISLWLDTRNGGNGTLLGDRQLHAASIVSLATHAPVSTFDCARHLCLSMAQGIDVPRRRGGIDLRSMIGTNDWYYAYGKNEPANILHDAEFARELAPHNVQPFTVIDDGYQDRRRFPDMAALAKQIAAIGTVPGIWIRPLRAPKSTAKNLLLPNDHWGWRVNRQPTLAYDPTIPEARAAAMSVVTEATGWGYRLLKHDFTTFEILGMWGNEMGPTPTIGNWHFHDRSRTNAEIITDFYRDLRSAAGNDTVIQGCNTVGHLSVGIFDASRIGDDVSGREWERTRRRGVNALPFRLPQHGAFFCVDPDIVAITDQVPWSLTKQWLHVVAASGTTLLISAAPGALGAEQKKAVREAYALCTSPGSKSVPLDWMETTNPTRWSGEPVPYHWDEPQGASPFEVGALSSTRDSMMVVS